MLSITPSWALESRRFLVIAVEHYRHGSRPHTVKNPNSGFLPQLTFPLSKMMFLSQVPERAFSALWYGGAPKRDFNLQPPLFEERILANGWTPAGNEATRAGRAVVMV